APLTSYTQHILPSTRVYLLVEVKMKSLSGHTFSRYKEEELDIFRKEFPADLQSKGLIRVNPGNWTVPIHFDQAADKIYQFKFRESDIIVNTCPKAGTTWVQEIIWNMKNNPNLDNPAAKLSQGDRSPLLEMDAYTGSEGPYFESVFDQVHSKIGEVNERLGVFLKLLDTLPSPRIIKSHLPLSLLPPDTLDSTKLVYVARNPIDVCISYYHFSRLLKDINYSGTFDQFVQRFIEGNMMSLPFWEHVHYAWKRRNHPNLHFIFYEDLKKNTYKEVKKLDKFLETGLTEEQLQNVIKFSSFSSMRERGVVAFGVVETKDHMNMELKDKQGGFLRKGIVGDWKNSSDSEAIDKIKIWIDDMMKDMEVPFTYNIN
ncbi:unnamed protein product, partial [Meganyctiphanes norvegica]